MSKSDDLENEIRGLFTQSIEQIPVKDEVEHASHIANRQRGFIDAIIMICVGAMAVFSAFIAPKYHPVQHPVNQDSSQNQSKGETLNE